MKILLTLLAALALCLPCAAQDAGDSGLLFAAPVWSYLGTTVNNFTCTGTTCTITAPASLQPGDVLVAALGWPGNTTSAVSGSGGGGTWQICTGCTMYNSALGFQVWALYSVNDTTTGTQTFTFTITPTQPNWSVIFQVFRCSGCSAYGPITFDQIGTPSIITTNCSPCTGSAFAQLAGQDLIEQLFLTGSGGSSVTAPYLLDVNGDVVYALGSSSGAAPQFTLTTAAAFMSNGLSFRP